jgi:hypothetical protein
MPELQFSFTMRVIENRDLVIKTARIGLERHVARIRNVSGCYYLDCDAPSNLAAIDIQEVAAYAIVKALTKSHVVLALNQQFKVSSNEFLVS